MYENFNRIPEGEQRRILDACIQEFAEQGYIAASTNSIVKNAGIPKGTLFFFFGSKKGLFLYLIDRAIAQYQTGLMQRAETLPNELFERLLYLGRERMRFAVQEPLLYRLLFQAFVNLPADIQAEIQSRYASYAAASREILYKDLDLTCFREGVEVEKAILMVTTLMEGVFNRSLAELRNLSAEQSLLFIDKLTGEVQLYFEMIKHGIYKPT